MKTISIIIPEHTQDKLEALKVHYCVPDDMLVQKLAVDAVDDLYQAVIINNLLVEED